MIERELDREDSQNQALQYQKNINEVITYSDITYRPTSALQSRLLQTTQLPSRSTRLTYSGDQRRPLTTIVPSVIKRSSLTQRSQMRSPTASSTTGSAKKVWFCDQKKQYFPTRL